MTQVVDVFIASPSDVGTERRYAEDVIKLVSIRTRDTLDIVLHPVLWENFIPSATACALDRVQDRFTARVRKCGIFIGILHQRYGSEIDDSRRISGTQEEFEEAIKNRQSIEILTYFRIIGTNVPSNPNVVGQLARLQALQERLKSERLLYHQYDTPREFRERLLLDLFEALVRIRTEAERREQLASFFRFGVNARGESPAVLLAYPPIHKHVQPTVLQGKTAQRTAQKRAKYNWHERLVPNVVYEDFKCIQKIEAAVRHTGVLDISSVTVDHPRLGIDQGNRIWLCLPRNEIGSSHLARLGARARFRFERDPGEERPHIIWCTPGKAHSKIIRSPMARYLEMQRPPKHSSWDPKFGLIVARDYAVIGRFAVENPKGLTRGEPYFHYYVAGIRGLGTWGAGWYIDRRPDELQRLTRAVENDLTGLQVLLEVTYWNNRILSVDDVTSRDQEYFDSQNTDATIRSVIDRLRL